MTSETRKAVLVIDDDPDNTKVLLGNLYRIADVVHPRDLDRAQLKYARVVLVDHRLDPENWTERDALPLAAQPMDGVAIAGIILGHLRNSAGAQSPTVVALFSNELKLLTPGFSAPTEHLAARISGLDWAFAKSSDTDTLERRVKSLLRAVRELPKAWPEEAGPLVNQLSQLLGLERTTRWSQTALDHVLRCHPPIHELADWSSGLAFMKWWMHSILPYPTCLVDRQSLALRLGTTPNWLEKHLTSGTRLWKILRASLYSGILDEFMPERWWVAGIDHVIWSKAAKGALDRGGMSAWLKSLTDDKPEATTDDDTLVVGEQLTLTSQVGRLNECVRISPDDWPVYADQAWTTIALARAIPRLGSLVTPDDMHKLKAGA
jgi:hypothetical protein